MEQVPILQPEASKNHETIFEEIKKRLVEIFSSDFSFIKTVTHQEETRPFKPDKLPKEYIEYLEKTQNAEYVATFLGEYVGPSNTFRSFKLIVEHFNRKILLKYLELIDKDKIKDRQLIQTFFVKYTLSVLSPGYYLTDDQEGDLDLDFSDYIEKLLSINEENLSSLQYIKELTTYVEIVDSLGQLSVEESGLIVKYYFFLIKDLRFKSAIDLLEGQTGSELHDSLFNMLSVVSRQSSLDFVALFWFKILKNSGSLNELDDVIKTEGLDETIGCLTQLSKLKADSNPDDRTNFFNYLFRSLKPPKIEPESEVGKIKAVEQLQELGVNTEDRNKKIIDRLQKLIKSLQKFEELKKSIDTVRGNQKGPVRRVASKLTSGASVEARKKHARAVLNENKRLKQKEDLQKQQLDKLRNQLRVLIKELRFSIQKCIFLDSNIPFGLKKFIQKLTKWKIYKLSGNISRNTDATDLFKAKYLDTPNSFNLLFDLILEYIGVQITTKENSDAAEVISVLENFVLPTFKTSKVDEEKKESAEEVLNYLNSLPVYHSDLLEEAKSKLEIKPQSISTIEKQALNQIETIVLSIIELLLSDTTYEEFKNIFSDKFDSGSEHKKNILFKAICHQVPQANLSHLLSHFFISKNFSDHGVGIFFRTLISKSTSDVYQPIVSYYVKCNLIQNRNIEYFLNRLLPKNYTTNEITNDFLVLVELLIAEYKANGNKIYKSPDIGDKFFSGVIELFKLLDTEYYFKVVSQLELDWLPNPYRNELLLIGIKNLTLTGLKNFPVIKKLFRSRPAQLTHKKKTKYPGLTSLPNSDPKKQTIELVECFYSCPFYVLTEIKLPIANIHTWRDGDRIFHPYTLDKSGIKYVKAEQMKLEISDLQKHGGDHYDYIVYRINTQRVKAEIGPETDTAPTYNLELPMLPLGDINISLLTEDENLETVIYTVKTIGGLVTSLDLSGIINPCNVIIKIQKGKLDNNQISADVTEYKINSSNFGDDGFDFLDPKMKLSLKAIQEELDEDKIDVKQVIKRVGELIKKIGARYDKESKTETGGSPFFASLNHLVTKKEAKCDIISMSLALILAEMGLQASFLGVKCITKSGWEGHALVGIKIDNELLILDPVGLLKPPYPGRMSNPNLSPYNGYLDIEEPVDPMSVLWGTKSLADRVWQIANKDIEVPSAQIILNIFGNLKKENSEPDLTANPENTPIEIDVEKPKTPEQSSPSLEGHEQQELLNKQLEPEPKEFETVKSAQVEAIVEFWESDDYLDTRDNWLLCNNFSGGEGYEEFRVIFEEILSQIKSHNYSLSNSAGWLSLADLVKQNLSDQKNQKINKLFRKGFDLDLKYWESVPSVPELIQSVILEYKSSAEEKAKISAVFSSRFTDNSDQSSEVLDLYKKPIADLYKFYKDNQFKETSSSLETRFIDFIGKIFKSAEFLVNQILTNLEKED